MKGTELHNNGRIIRRKRCNSKRWRKISTVAIATSLLVIVCCGLFGSFLSSAHSNREEKPVNFKYYKSVTIEQGDTLWAIAEEYITDDYDSIEEYISAIKKLNNLHGNTIKAGDKIMVAYNDTDFLK